MVDSLVTGKRANMASFADRVEFIEGDLADDRRRAAAVEGMEFVLHQAAIPSVPRSVAEPERCHRANVDATLNVLLAAAGTPASERLVFAGSSSVYGNSATLPKREDMPPNPLSPYALHKLIGEQYARLFTSLYGLETVTIRYFNVFGPRQDPVVAVLRRDLAVHPCPGGGPVADHLRRRRTDPRFHVRRQRGGRRPEGVHGARRRPGRVFNVATGGRDVAQSPLPRRSRS